VVSRATPGILLFAFAVLGAIACTPTRSIPPEPSPPAEVERRPDSAIPVLPPTRQRSFRYTPGELRYVLDTEASITVTTDSGASLPGTSASRMVLSLAVDSSTSSPSIKGSIDSFTVRSSERVPRSTLLQLPLPIRWSTSSVGDPDTLSCTPEAELRRLGQDLLLRFPDNLRDNTRWRERTATRLCREGVPLTLATTHDYEVVGLTQLEGDSVLLIRKSTSANIIGSREGSGPHIAITGSSKGLGEIYLNLALGRLIARREESRTELTITSPRGRTLVTQELRSQLRLEP
jgi:hypothetical protein